MSEDWKNDPRFNVKDKAIDIARRRWDELGWLDQDSYGSFDKFFKSKDWRRPEDGNLLILGSSEVNIKSKKKIKKLGSKNKIKKLKKVKKKASKRNKIKTKKKKPKYKHPFTVYGFEYDKEYYINTWIPEVEKILKENIRNSSMSNYPVKILKTNKGKYWNSDPIYPKSRNEFIHRFFDKRSPKGLEGIWHWGQWSILGIVKEGSVYQMYDIDVIAKNQWKINKGAIDSFFDGLTGEQNASQNIDYHLCNGTKGGALIPTKAKNKFKLNCKGVYIVPSEDGSYSFAHEEQTQNAFVQNNNLIVTRANFGDTEETMKRLWPESTDEDDLQFSNKQKGSSSGTGFFVDDKGHIITNYHVIASCQNKQKIIYNNREIKAKLIAKDKQLDLALLKVNLNNKHFIKITNKPIKKLQSIIAAGYPGGKALSDDLKFTSGIISSLKGLEDNSAQIQIDAALNFGNSGGPIVDSRNGELTAVAVSILRNEITEGINFGVKVSQVRDFLYANKIDTQKISKRYKGKNLNTILENSVLYVFCN